MDDFESMVRDQLRSVFHDDILEVSESFTAEFEIRGSGTPISQQFGSYDEMTAVTGLYFPEDRLMIVDSRLVAHHNNQWQFVENAVGPLSPVVPWASATVGGKFVVELGRSHGGLSQALRRYDRIGEVEVRSHGMDIRPETVLAVAYASRITDHPADNTDYEYTFRPTGLDGVPEDVIRELRVDRYTESMDNLYDLLRVCPSGLPDPFFKRGSL